MVGVCFFNPHTPSGVRPHDGIGTGFGINVSIHTPRARCDNKLIFKKICFEITKSTLLYQPFFEIVMNRKKN